MTLARPVYPRSTSMTTRRCTQRQYLLRPDAETNNAFLYCLIVAAQKYQIDVLDFVQMSNHLHDGIYDRHGNGPAFYEHFHKLLAKCVNALRGRWENVFASEQVCVVRLEGTEELIDKLVYIATNPVKAGLVERVDEWPGASGYHAFVEGKVLRAKRPRHFFSEHGTMPEEVSLRLRIPPELGDHDVIVAAVKARVRQVERAEARKRAESGQRVLGRYAVLRQSWRDSPTSREPRRGLRPTFVARSIWALLERSQRKRRWQSEYRQCRDLLLAGARAVFPHGTYWLRRFFGVEVKPISAVQEIN